MQSRNFTGSKLTNSSSNTIENKDNIDKKENYIKEVVTPLGDIYILNEKTNEKFIKGTQRSDGTFRKNIRVRTDYMPQVKGKILEEQNKNKYISENIDSIKGVNLNNIKSINTYSSVNKTGEKKVPGWNPVNENENAKNLKKKKKKKKKAKNEKTEN
ncbi:mago-binding protein [Plasmodium brasilianum]|uniref:WIBG Mago-binding domain-containing protein n=2 Tax=Plasmodium (Plasmodium) TaxID=418103 RepID=A0A1A8WP15_PLAMA|nr:conserved Plasmodium protein, unknown function [Plasmodium malariae]KAI4835615.1 mago-binding protein [Plasmodium brasilianum]SBS93600.1 hypothetical protein, conserved [Plasmodium malariae]SCP02542.1 conserved Plasmodium protein, unknown function [Plasmodium malariae]